MTDSEFMAHVVSEICDYAVRNEMEPNDTIKTIAENLLFLLEISTFNTWKPSEESSR